MDKGDRMYMYLIFQHILQERQNLWIPVCFLAHQSPAEKGFTLKERMCE